MTFITLKFNEGMERAILEGRKCCTTRDTHKGQIGDIFRVGERVYRLIAIVPRGHPYECNDFRLEGFETLDEFRDVIEAIYPHLKPDRTGTEMEIIEEETRIRPVYVHYFAFVSYWCPNFGCAGACIDPEKCVLYPECREGWA